MHDRTGGGATPGRRQVSGGLNLALRLKTAQRMRELMREIDTMLPRVRAALAGLNYVHFARFLPTPDGSTLLVITEFDGELDRYVMDFASVLSDEFSAILAYVEDAPPLPVSAHREAFRAFVQRHNEDRIQPWSAYPDLSVIDIVGPSRPLPAPFADAPRAEVDLGDVQGNVLNGYNARHARHFALEVESPDGARRFLAGLLSGDDAASPQVTSAVLGHEPPAYFLNVGFTLRGLAVFGVNDVESTFPAAFVDGPAHPVRALRHGDAGPAAPERWRLGAPGHTVHLFVSLYAKRSREVLDDRSAQLRALFYRHGLKELDAVEAEALPDQAAHFGYRDGIAQPRVHGVPGRQRPDGQPLAGAGEFLLGRGYLNPHGGDSLGSVPEALGRNGSFAVVRLMQQDCAAFERLLQESAERHGLDPELVAAKLMGRWRSGTPLSLAPDADRALPEGRVNDFDFAPNARNAALYEDAGGLRCPIGSHVRRMNPRGGLVAGKPYSRRLMRRGMPYGPPWNPALPDDGMERGLLGLFFCSDIESQFEFLLNVWALDGLQASGIRHERDPLLGGEGTFSFRLPGRAQPVTLALPRLVTTRGSLYLFVPGLAALRGLASPARRPEPVPAVSRAPAFDPHDPAFLADPYPAYRRLRDTAHGVHHVERYASHWVFRYEDVRRVCEARDVFLKPGSAAGAQGPLDVLQYLPDGVFYMNPPRHGQVRSMLDPLFAEALAPAAAVAEEEAAARLAALSDKPVFDLLQDYARPLTARVFMEVMGVPPTHRPALGEWVVGALDGHNIAEAPWKRARAGTCSMTIRSYFQGLTRGCPMHAESPGTLMDLMAARLRAAEPGPGSMSVDEIQQTAHNLALGGYLSTEFLILTGVYHLLRHPEQLAWLRAHADEGLRGAAAEMLRYEAPFQLADRVTAREVELGGVRLKAGSRVTVVFGSANRDERVFHEPDRFDIRRQPAVPHFGLGHGDHYCIGAPLVGIVAPIALRRLLEALPGLALPPRPVEWQKDPYFRSFVELVLQTGRASSDTPPRENPHSDGQATLQSP